VQRVLFICSQNRLRSPTAEQVFSSYPDLEVASAGLSSDAAVQVSPEMLDWADVVFVMERAHSDKLSRQFAPYLRDKRVVCLDIADDYEFMDPELVRLLEMKVPALLRAGVKRGA
jgi:predicted protein tyrosine phosphatase